MKTQVSIIICMILVGWSANADMRYSNTSPVQIKETVFGVAKAITAGTIKVDDIIVKLSAIRDLDKHRQVCIWRAKWRTKPNKFPPSVDAASYSEFCNAYPGGTTLTAENTYKCELAFTAVDQMAKLKEIVDGKKVSCKIPTKADMKQFWKVGLHKSRSGDKEYPGHCYIGAKSVSASLVGTGWSSMVPEFNHGIIDPDYEMVKTILVDDFNKRLTGGSKLRSSHVTCLSDGNHVSNPDWYNN